MPDNQEEVKVEQPVAPTQEQTAESAKPAEQEENPQQIDWKRFKEARKKERQEKEEAQREAIKKAQEADALKAALEALVNKPAQNQSAIQDDTEDDRIQRKINEALEKERQRNEEQQRKREQDEAPKRLLSAFPDFNTVCSSENIDYLEFHHPETAKALESMKDGFDKWSYIYKAVKRYVPNNSSNKDQKRAEKNTARPQSMSVGGVTQTGDHAPKMLDEKRKADNWAAMQKRMKGIL